MARPCIEFQGYRDKDGYGQSGRCTKAHRAAFLAAYGWLPRLVMHTCDNPPCIEPTHLVAGSAKANSRDMARKGRQWQQKVTPPIAAQICAAYQRGATRQADLAETFGVDQTTISRIVLRKGVV